MQAFGDQSALYYVATDRWLSNANALLSRHIGKSEVIMTVLQMDEGVLPGHAHSGVPSVDTVCTTVGVVVLLLLQVINGAVVDIVSFCNNQVMLPCMQLANSLFSLC